MWFLLIYGGMYRVRALIQVPLDRWLLSGHYGIRHFELTLKVYEIWVGLKFLLGPSAS